MSARSWARCVAVSEDSEATALVDGAGDGKVTGSYDEPAGPAAADEAGASYVGTEALVEVGPIAHGGHCVARWDSLVVFVRHALPGERVRIRITRGKRGDRFLLADAVEVLAPSAHRVTPACRYARPAGCGGCDFQHVDLAHQRELKGAVVAEQLARLAGIEREVTVAAVPGDLDGLRWRTRIELAVDRKGRTGLHPHHSRAVTPIEDCLIAAEAIGATGVYSRRFPGSRAVHAVVSSEGERAVVAVPQGLARTPSIHESVRLADRELAFRLNALGFWQVHPGAAATLVQAVLDGLAPRSGERCLDLYAGVGVFAAALADAVGPDGAVLAVESDARAVASARGTFAGRPEVEVRQERVESALAPLLAGGDRVDLVVLDPPRAGAGRAVVESIARLRPRAVAYVACDPAALARDLRHAQEEGYRLVDLSAYDAFPMTHHVECVAILQR